MPMGTLRLRSLEDNGESNTTPLRYGTPQALQWGPQRSRRPTFGCPRGQREPRSERLHTCRWARLDCEAWKIMARATRRPYDTVRLKHCSGVRSVVGGRLLAVRVDNESHGQKGYT